MGGEKVLKKDGWLDDKAGDTTRKEGSVGDY